MEGDIAPDPRVRRTKAHVLAHARALLAHGGPAAVTYQELSTRARVTRQTLYRHWPTREALFVDLALERAGEGMPGGSGSPEEIVAAFLTGMRDGMQDAGNASPLTALIAHADQDPGSSNALRAIVTDRRAALNALLAPSGAQLTADEYAMLCGPVLFQRFFARTSAGDRLVRSLARRWWAERAGQASPADDAQP
ncbi:TetR/AcrR family transcriptional regulator [Amycolatopsis jiangsuensis]|uniref:AcrR family transcriptional regulator n=1 Tax=Amycolatopsis jiangsuensis TaxID=1181879 RepID=A0A840J443_9PSEU|nr:TetR/AcrR family transcriptional regulator [Amycolatopsis jiangsuensis]MBB4688207.1 AcrR family transcriptional regulator [Amycolatopsis jiangsuensis]